MFRPDEDARRSLVFPRLQRRACSYVDVQWEKSASRPIETCAPFVGGYQGDRIE